MGSAIRGLTDPYTGTQACSRRYSGGYTFRWVKGDRYIAVMRGTCVDMRRVFIIRDHLDGRVVHETPQPLVDVIAAPHGDWSDDVIFRRLVAQWLDGRS